MLTPQEPSGRRQGWVSEHSASVRGQPPGRLMAGHRDVGGLAHPQWLLGLGRPREGPRWATELHPPHRLGTQTVPLEH